MNARTHNDLVKMVVVRLVEDESWQSRSVLAPEDMTNLVAVVINAIEQVVALHGDNGNSLVNQLYDEGRLVIATVSSGAVAEVERSCPGLLVRDTSLLRDLKTISVPRAY